MKKLSKKQTAAMAAAGAIILLVAALALVEGCADSSRADTAADAIPATASHASEKADSEGAEATGAAENENPEGNRPAGSAANPEEDPASDAQDAPSDAGGTDDPLAPRRQAQQPDPSPTANPPASDAPRQQRWVEDTEQVWVEDRAAWTESVPVYGTKEISVCNICGADITGEASAHGKAHMLKGEGSGHHSEVRRTVTGYDAVEHPAEGHYETRVTGGHWE